MKQVHLWNENLSYSGRIDWSTPDMPQMIFPSSSLGFRFAGKQAILCLENHRGYWDNYVGAIVDGEQKCWKLEPKGITRISLVDETEEAEHEILFFKRQDSCHVITLKELLLSDESVLRKPAAKPERRMEVYGDSVSAGEVSEAVSYVGCPDPEHNGEYSNSWYSYSWIAARKLGAELHNISQGGIPLLNGAGWVCPPIYMGMESVWDKLHYLPNFGETTEWDFKKYIPHVVVLAVGQNDSNPQDYMKDNPTGQQAAYWKYKYGQLILRLREKYPRALIILTTTILCHDENWDRAMQEVCGELGDERVRYFRYSRCGTGTPGHLRIPEAEEMADELVEFIEKLDIPVWDA